MQRGKVLGPPSKEDDVSKEARGALSRCATRPACLAIDYDGPLLRNARFRVGTCMQSWTVGRANPKLCPWIRGHEAFTKAALLLPRTWKWVWIECNPHTLSPTPRHWGCHISNSASFSPCFSKPLSPRLHMAQAFKFLYEKNSFLNKAGNSPRYHHDETEIQDVSAKSSPSSPILPSPVPQCSPNPPCQTASSEARR